MDITPFGRTFAINEGFKHRAVLGRNHDIPERQDIELPVNVACADHLITRSIDCALKPSCLKMFFFAESIFLYASCQSVLAAACFL